MVAQVFTNLTAFYERYHNAMAPKVEEPTAEEKGRPLGKLKPPSADNHQFELADPYLAPLFVVYILAGTYGGYVCLTQAKLPTIIFTLFLAIPSMLGLTAGAHRLWSHHSYKTKLPLELLMLFFYLLANQRSLVTWVRHHRLHHLCADTDGDPHNASRGFFFANFTWMLVKPHPEVEKRLKHIDVSDLMSSPIIRFQEKYIIPLLLLVTNVIPISIPLLWGETLYVSIMSNLFRQIIVLHLANAVNSWAHLVGYKPIDKYTVGTQFRLLGILTLGDGFHNYHHTFPIDYKSSEFGDTIFNLSSLFIEFMAKIGWAYDLKEVSEESVKNRVINKGDGSDQYYLTEKTRTKEQEFCCLKFYEGFRDGYSN